MQQGKIAEAEAEFERLLGGSHVKTAIAELHKLDLDRADEPDVVSLSELLYGRHSRGIWLFLFPEKVIADMLCWLLCLFVSCIVLCYSLVPFAVVFIGSTLFALQQLSGINAVFYFSSTVFKSAGVPSDLANIFVGISNLLGTVAFSSDLFFFTLAFPLIWILDCNTVLIIRISSCDGVDG